MNPILYYEYGKGRSFLVYKNSIAPVSYTFTTGIALINNGTKLYLVPHNNTPKEYTLSTPYDLTTATFIRNGSLSLNCGGIWMSEDGTKYYQSVTSSNVIRQFTLNQPYDISSLANPIDSPILSNGQAGGLPFITSDGTKLFLKDNFNNLNTYNFGTAFDISTINLVSQVNIGTKDSYCFSSDGLKAYSILNTHTGTIFQQILTTPYDLTTVIKTNTSNQISVLTGGNFLRPWITNDNKLFISRYSSSSPFVNCFAFNIVF